MDQLTPAAAAIVKAVRSQVCAEWIGAAVLRAAVDQAMQMQQQDGPVIQLLLGIANELEEAQ